MVPRGLGRPQPEDWRWKAALWRVFPDMVTDLAFLGSPILKRLGTSKLHWLHLRPWGCSWALRLGRSEPA